MKYQSKKESEEIKDRGEWKKSAKKNTLEVGGDLRFHKGTLQYYRR